MKFYHTADIHLGAVPDKGFSFEQAREKGIWDSFFRLLRQARETQTDAVFICGDLFHRQPLLRELKEVNYQFAKAAPVRIFLIAGNHDYIAPDSAYPDYPWSENVTMLDTRECSYIYDEALGACIYGLSYYAYEIHASLYDDLAPVKVGPDGQPLPETCSHILLAHGGDEKHIPINFRRLSAAGFDYVALGHIHKPGTFAGMGAGKNGYRMDPEQNRTRSCIQAQIADARIAYSGALEPTDRVDEGPHGYIEGRIDGRRLRTRFVPFAQWQYQRLYAEAAADMSWGEIVDLVQERMVSEETLPGEEASANQAEAVGRASAGGRAEAVGRTGPGGRAEAAGSHDRTLYNVVLGGYKSEDLVCDFEDLYRLGNVRDVTDQMEYDFDLERLYLMNQGNLLGRYIEKVLGMDLDEKQKKKVLYEGLAALRRTGRNL